MSLWRLIATILTLVRKGPIGLGTQTSITTLSYHVCATARHSGRTSHICTAENYGSRGRKYVTRVPVQTVAMQSVTERPPFHLVQFMPYRESISFNVTYLLMDTRLKRQYSAPACDNHSFFSLLSTIVCFVALILRSQRPPLPPSDEEDSRALANRL